MSNLKKALFLIVLFSFVGASVYLSFNAISRPTYEYEEVQNISGTDVSGLAFVGFNGNPTTTDVRVYHPMVKNENKQTSDDPTYIEDTTRNIVAIDKFTFVSDENMQYCYIGPDVAYIDSQAFFGCFALRAVYVDEANPYYTSVDGVLYTKDMKEIIIYPTYHISHLQDIGKVEAGYYDTHPETFTIPEGVEKVAPGCFYKIWGIKEIVLPSTIKEIGKMGFFRCQSLELITLPDGLEKIGSDAFSYCFSMKGALYIPETVKEIGDHAFYKCNVDGDNIEGELYFYMGAQSETDFTAGGGWLPKHDNAFTSTKADYGKTREEAAAFTEEYLLQFNQQQ